MSSRRIVVWIMILGGLAATLYGVYAVSQTVTVAADDPELNDA